MHIGLGSVRLHVGSASRRVYLARLLWQCIVWRLLPSVGSIAKGLGSRHVWAWLGVEIRGVPGV